eukprot:scaffold31440_cov19-Tisochrysis_lutea.AAC.1
MAHATSMEPTLCMQNFPSTALTFEAWISTSDFCHSGLLAVLANFACRGRNVANNKTQQDKAREDSRCR